MKIWGLGVTPNEMLTHKKKKMINERVVLLDKIGFQW
jgi:hypothetical protein